VNTYDLVYTSVPPAAFFRIRTERRLLKLPENPGRMAHPIKPHRCSIEPDAVLHPVALFAPSIRKKTCDFPQKE
jgi:hypothetical protein